MKAAVVNVLGQPPRYQDFPEPTPNAGEALIRVRAAGLHPIVKALASGSHYAGNGEVPSSPASMASGPSRWPPCLLHLRPQAVGIDGGADRGAALEVPYPARQY